MTLDLNWHSANLWEPPTPTLPETETKPIKSVASRTPIDRHRKLRTWEVIQSNLHLKYQKVLFISFLLLLTWGLVIFSHVTKLTIIAQMLALPLAL